MTSSDDHNLAPYDLVSVIKLPVVRVDPQFGSTRRFGLTRRFGSTRSFGSTQRFGSTRRFGSRICRYHSNYFAIYAYEGPTGSRRRQGSGRHILDWRPVDLATRVWVWFRFESCWVGRKINPRAFVKSDGNTMVRGWRVEIQAVREPDLIFSWRGFTHRVINCCNNLPVDIINSQSVESFTYKLSVY